MVSALCELDPLDDDEDFSRSLINYFDAHDRLIPLLKWAISQVTLHYKQSMIGPHNLLFCVKQEIRSTTKAATLFRGGSMATKLLSIYTFDKGLFAFFLIAIHTVT